MIPTRLRIALIARSARRLIEAGRPDAAEALLAPALSRWPAGAALLEAWARVAHGGGRYQEAVTRWQALLAVAPRSAVGLSSLASNQRELGDLDLAKATIARAIALHPGHTAVISEAARVATLLHEHGEALALYRRIVDRRDAPTGWRQQRDWNLIMLGRLEEAEVAIAQSRKQAPSFRGHDANEIILRIAQERWDDARVAARAYRARHPDDAVGAELLASALHGAAFAEADGTRALHHVPVEVERIEDPTTRALMLGFESLGQDCEFGLVQRRYGAEPLGLLRWNVIALPQLIEALAARFEGLGGEAETELGVFAQGEYLVLDRRYGLSMHTFAYRHQAEPDVVLPKFRTRLAYLRDKFVDDLAAAEKVFVYKRADVDLGAVRALHDALRAYGPVRLVWVVPLDRRPADVEAIAPGEVRRLGDGLHVACLTRYGRQGETWNILFDEWVAICREAARRDG